ncbi:UDP-4-amino-4,6-dideoxy-N-acetyl-beta-L-altrosamine N-acetyltransferase [Pseudomonas brassicacearum]|uniref:UDP-4-amino-4, 6-dideoxy-N-acetyl-beta-L-altrosamine N-acetyltransferase n=1 Tax=Pseudomonas brassicacearum TaxID=930166 RepID=A0AAJ3FS64_9PSED|nr:UDP-4-amino-4,6-dideoxy-N-acetyl-beta-L-altrosamine N-acetyltransferase [Pseudomonas brassicacearum]NUT79799.1 UDP-4-amino-4,6-dideoxy-N-acetyl-beta-L-altrosamine N-acetyltransferase [Pseudomonas brassicacearum]
METLGQLREINTAELELMLSWRNAPNVRANMYTRHEISLKEHLAWWERVQLRDDQLYFMCEIDGKPTGIVGFNDLDLVNSISSWAFYAAPDAPKGTGSKMEFLALDHAFKHMRLHKLMCEVLAFNAPVIKLHQKFNFKVEGVLREHHSVNGEYVDVYKLGILSREWEAHRSYIYAKLMKLSRSKK